MKNLSSFGVQELNRKELRKIEGGAWVVIVIGLAWSAWNNIGDIRDGWHDGSNNLPPRHHN